MGASFDTHGTASPNFVARDNIKVYQCSTVQRAAFRCVTDLTNSTIVLVDKISNLFGRLTAALAKGAGRPAA